MLAAAEILGKALHWERLLIAPHTNKVRMLLQHGAAPAGTRENAGFHHWPDFVPVGVTSRVKGTRKQNVPLT